MTTIDSGIYNATMTTTTTTTRMCSEQLRLAAARMRMTAYVIQSLRLEGLTPGS